MVQSVCSAPAAGVGASPAETPQTAQRYLALDAYRGFIMIVLCSGGFGFRALAKTPGFEWIAAQFDHVPWEGGVFWDMIQPAFMFMVGMAMPFAMARRVELGAGFGELFRHTGVRALKLILLSQVLICIAGNKLTFQLINVLCQIAFTYFLCFLIMRWKFRWQVVAAGLLLALHWALFVLFPGPDGPFSKTDNIGSVIDRAVIGYIYSGFYVTINFLSSTVTTLFGVWAGELVRTPRSLKEKLWRLIAMAAASSLLAMILGLFIPNVKRIWTPTFTFYSMVWVLLMLAGFFYVIEILGYRRWAFPLVVVGMNSIFIYSLNQVLTGWINRSLAVFTGRFEFIGTLAPVAQATSVMLVMWYLCYWFYKRKIFFKL